jgi:hypothetical protein
MQTGMPIICNRHFAIYGKKEGDPAGFLQMVPTPVDQRKPQSYFCNTELKAPRQPKLTGQQWGRANFSKEPNARSL